MEGDGMNLAIGGAAFGSLCTVAVAWIKARFAKTPADEADRYVSCEQCRQHRERIEKRVDAQMEMFARVSDKLDMIESHNEDRAKRMHDRLDPVIRTTAETAGVLRQHLEDHRAARTGGQ